MIPAFTKPMSIIVVADELWIIPVTRVPSPHPLSIPTILDFPDVSFSRILCIPAPASFLRADPIILIP